MSEDTLSSPPPSLPMPMTMSCCDAGHPRTSARRGWRQGARRAAATAASSASSARRLIAPQTSVSGAVPARSRTSVCRNTRRRRARNARASPPASCVGDRRGDLRGPHPSEAASMTRRASSARKCGCRRNGAVGIAAEGQSAVEVHGGKQGRSAERALRGPPRSFGYNSPLGRPLCLSRAPIPPVPPWSPRAPPACFASSASSPRLASRSSARCCWSFASSSFRGSTITAAGSSQQLAAALGQPVTIDAIDTGWDGWNPRLSIRGMAIRDRAAPRARRCSTCRSVDLVVAWTRCSSLDLRLKELTIERPRVVACAATSAGACTSRASRSTRSSRADDTRFTEWLCGSGRSCPRRAGDVER